MSKFNSKSVAKTSTTYEGGEAYLKNDTEAWFNMLFGSYLEPTFYETAGEQLQRFIDLTNQIIEKVGPEFVANAACFSRDELGLRSISQLTAALLNNRTFDDKRLFFRNFVQRPDDMSEIFAAIDMVGGKRSHAIVRGFADYLETLDSYKLGKYKMLGHDYNMYDLINICHPKPNAAIQAFKNDRLEAPDTWEVKISTSKSKEEKAQNWKELVENNQLGYIALIRNLRNILDTNPNRSWLKEYLVPQIINPTAIRKSRIFPYQIYTAYKMLHADYPAMILDALEEAFIIACKNVPKLDGKTAIMLDVSGSMENRIAGNSNITIKEVGAVFATMYTLAGNDIDCIKFGDAAKRFQVNPSLSPFRIVDYFANNDECGWGTDIRPAFNLLDRHYDRILLISDMQCMGGKNSYWWSDRNNIDTYKDYCCEYGDTHIYSFDLGNYHTQIANPNNPYVHLCTALNEKVFELMKFIESNSQSLIDYINTHYNYKLANKKIISPMLSLAS